MKKLAALLALSLSFPAFAQNQPKEKPMTLRSVLLEQLKTTHNVEDWFVPANIAVQGLTAEQVNWKSTPNSHSIGQLTYHILFWDKESLAKFKGEAPEKFSGNNDDTFNNFDSKKWDATVRELDEVMTDVDEVLEGQGEAVLHKARGDEDAFGRAETDIAMADGAIAEIDCIGGGDGRLVAFADGERHKVVRAAGEGAGHGRRHSLHDALQVLRRDLRISEACITDAVGRLLDVRLLSDLGRGEQGHLGGINHKLVF